MKNETKEYFNINKYNHLIDSANDFFEAAIRCSFDDSLKSKRYPLMVPQFTNRAFACELYIKATLYLTKNELHKGHNLNNLFLELNKKVQKEIYDIWRTVEENDIQDSDYYERMFYDNLEANSEVFSRFRYIHEWAGASISLHNSFTENQMHLHKLSASRPFGSPSIYDGFLEQFAKAIHKYNNKEIRKKWMNI